MDDKLKFALRRKIRINSIDDFLNSVRKCVVCDIIYKERDNIGCHECTVHPGTFSYNDQMYTCCGGQEKSEGCYNMDHADTGPKMHLQSLSSMIVCVPEHFKLPKREGNVALFQEIDGNNHVYTTREFLDANPLLTLHLPVGWGSLGIGGAISITGSDGVVKRYGPKMHLNIAKLASKQVLLGSANKGPSEKDVLFYQSEMALNVGAGSMFTASDAAYYNFDDMPPFSVFLRVAKCMRTDIVYRAHNDD